MWEEFYQNLPLKINPFIFNYGFFSLRWYSFFYLVAFLWVYFFLKQQLKLKKADNFLKNYSLEKKENFLLGFLFWEFLAIIFGARIGYVFFYNLHYFWENPLAIISPYDKFGNFTGIFGMSYHGALLSAILVGYLFAKIKKINFWELADFTIRGVSLGYFFGRIGNFFNDELYGRITTMPWGMYFQGDSLNLRHPSQLYEAFLEGIAIFLILKWRAKKNNFSGELFLIYLSSYAIFRIIVEQFREPDIQVGFLFLGLTMGQILSLGMLICVSIVFLKRNLNAILKKLKVKVVQKNFKLI